jgi:hypothetical protein
MHFGVPNDADNWRSHSGELSDTYAKELVLDLRKFVKRDFDAVLETPNREDDVVRINKAIFSETTV